MCESFYEVVLLIVALALSTAVFLSSWVTLFLFTRDKRESAVVSAITAVVTGGLCFATAYFSAFVLLRPFAGWFDMLALFTTETLVVSMGISYLHLLNRKKAVLSGLYISGASIASVFFFFSIFLWLIPLIRRIAFS